MVAPGVAMPELSFLIVGPAVGILAAVLAHTTLLRVLRRQSKELEKRSEKLDNQERELEAARREASAKVKQAEDAQLRLDRYIAVYRKRLQTLAQLTQEEAREDLRAELLQRGDDEVREIRREILERTEEEVRRDAERILVTVMERMATRVEREVCATIVPIPSEDMKGRVIGREGRNIRSFETATGVTLMIDETPGSILISSFDPVRREIARMALESLVKDGRIHPASIEETVARVESEVRESVTAIGESALVKLRIGSVAPEVVNLLGKLHFRHSNNQNTLDHSIEVAYFASLIASEIGADPIVAKRCGLFHDLGKAIDHQHESSHAKAAANILRRYGEDPRVINAVEASHDEVDAISLYAGITRIADSLSAARPGVRTDSIDGYLQRVHSLEKTARQFSGVADAYAIQAGHEIRVIVDSGEVDDAEARSLSRRIRRRIEDELNYPGSIKVVVVRESRFTETAR